MYLLYITAILDKTAKKNTINKQTSSQTCYKIFAYLYECFYVIRNKKSPSLSFFAF